MTERPNKSDELVDCKQQALELAVAIIMENEPGDSRAVSDVAVALCAVSVGDVSKPVMTVIRDSLARYSITKRTEG